MSGFFSSASLVLIMASFSASFGITAGFTDSRDVDIMLSLQQQWENTPLTWKGRDPCGSGWDGVSCTGSRITSMILTSASLTGQLPEEIGLLSFLEFLDLSYNPGLTGPIPSSLGNLQHLLSLILLGCGFSGSIPKELGNLGRLVNLDLNSNGLSGNIPPSLGNLTSLNSFDISNNSIGGQLPVELKGLVNCGHFHFNKNHLTGSIPPEIFHENMTLRRLLFDCNILTGEIPSTLGSVSTLTVVRLDRNNLGGPAPSNIGKLVQVTELQLSYNQLTGFIPDLSRMINLRYLDLSGNFFEVSDVPAWLSSLVSLNTIMMESSNLNGQVPFHVFNLPQLETVGFSNNSIDGSLETDAIVNQQLQLIDLRYNNITSVSIGVRRDNTLGLDGNPVCNPGTYISDSKVCHSGHIPGTAYQTDMAHCKNDITCSEDLLKVHPKSCQCAMPYVGTMIFCSTSFASLTQATRFKILEKSLWTDLNLSEGAVNIFGIWFDASSYLNVQVQFFPPPGKKYFQRSKIVMLSSALSSRAYQPPKEFGPYYFIPTAPYIFSADRSKGLFSRSIIGLAVGVAASFLGIVALLFYELRNRRNAVRDCETTNPFASWGLAYGGDSRDAPKLKSARLFSFEELKLATNNFSPDNEIGGGGYGKVYKGILPVSKEMVAVKRAKNETAEADSEFKAELELLSQVHHKNLVALIGFCFKEGEHMLVYEYFSNGSLSDNLHGKRGIRLDWQKRCRIALGAARGLAYLHHHAEPPVIHRDVKSSNILLDKNMNAKVSDFGLSKHVPESANGGPVETEVKGTPGYVDPEYFVTRKPTQKGDVYGFGVVLLEILTSRQPLVEDAIYLVDEVKTTLEIGGISAFQRHLLDPFIRDSLRVEILLRLVRLALRCVSDSATNRPNMRSVVKKLEAILEGPCDAAITIVTCHDDESETAAFSCGADDPKYLYGAVISRASFHYSGTYSLTDTVEPK